MKRNQPKQTYILDDKKNPIPANKHLVKKSVVEEVIHTRGGHITVQNVVKCTHKITNKFSGVYDPKNYKKKRNKGIPKAEK